MAQRNHANAKIELDGPPKEVVAGVIIAQMYQAQCAAKSHPDAAAREQIITATDLVLKLLEGYTTPAVLAALPRIQAILAETTPIPAAV